MKASGGESCSPAYFFISPFFSSGAVAVDGDGVLVEPEGALDGELELVGGVPAGFDSCLPQAASATAAAAANSSNLFIESS
jgi:hypothetical protein